MLLSIQIVDVHYLIGVSSDAGYRASLHNRDAGLAAVIEEDLVELGSVYLERILRFAAEPQRFIAQLGELNRPRFSRFTLDVSGAVLRNESGTLYLFEYA